MKDNKKIRVGITHGDINGIGYEVILKALEDSRMLELCTPIIYGSAKIANYYRKQLELPQFAINQVAKASEARDGACSIINVVGEDTLIEPGKATATAGKAAFIALEQAVADLRNGYIDALVTAPINKDTIQSDTFNFPGHTEYLEASLGDGDKALMILCNENVRVALVTTHLPIAQIPSAITKEAIVEKLEIFNNSLKNDFGINYPRIAVLSLNPHAGENGLLGKEEQEIISPALVEGRDKNIQCYGPYAADGLFGSGLYSKFDGILAMYHDQGLAPFKTLAMESGVNFTAGLQFVRTSPDHGTGYDIAGKGLASESSLRQAIYHAIDVVRCRRNEAYIHRNPLRKQYFDKGKDNVVLDLTKDEHED
ncbi:MAG: 4-hydroxythreonine-4-phosphate dehydrogenase PdxA [Muribaculaceae bacterium]|nr:4-hydroxythreonine-4-phosphate dehydrogenase PdxA [Muribaculaceae bacterium]